MNPTRFTRHAVTLGMACLILTGTALAGTTTVTEVTYAREVGRDDTVYTIPAGNSIERAMSLLRSGDGSGDFFVAVSLGNNAEFDGTGLPVAADLTQSGGLPAGNVVITLPTTPTDGDTSVEFFVDVTATFTSFPSFTLDTSGWAIQDPDSLYLSGGVASRLISRLGTGISHWYYVAKNI